MHVVGLDIGGANLKAADTAGNSQSRCFALWKEPGRLSGVLGEILEGFASADVLAVTMTGELADCFETKADGVDFILRSVESVAGSAAVQVWQTGAEFVSPAVAREIPLLVAAANWHALATWIGRIVPNSSALMIDVGSTTTDIVPLADGIPVPAGLTDVERLQSGELVYTGVRRTPLCAIADAVPFRGGECLLAAELFATTVDVYLTLGLISENASDCETANGRPATRADARDRLARMLCCDRTEFSQREAERMSRFLVDRQMQQISQSVDSVLERQSEECDEVLISGTGSFLAERIVQTHEGLKDVRVIRLAEILDKAASQAACAAAVARLAGERLSAGEHGT